MAEVPILTLNNGVKIPQLGLGVWQASDDEAEFAVGAALKAGYRLIDTAAIYRNETGVGRAIAASGIPREELFVTTKLWNDEQGYDSTLNAFDESLKKLGLDYVDLYLIHWPTPSRGLYNDTWRAFEKLYADGRIKAIGVSNFPVEQLEDLISKNTIVPTVNQVELHPDFQQRELREYCDQHDIKIESWSPIGGRTVDSLLKNETIVAVAKKHGKTAAQVAIRWHIESDLIVIPKSVHEERIIENFDVIDFELDDDDMAQIEQLDGNNRVGSDPARG